MATEARILPPRAIAPRSIGRSALLTLPIMLWSLLDLLEFIPATESVRADCRRHDRGFHDCAVFHDDADVEHLSMAPLVLRGAGTPVPGGLHPHGHGDAGIDGHPHGGDDCGPNALLLHAHSPPHPCRRRSTRTVVFPGSILPGGGMSGSGIAAMVGLWLAITSWSAKAGAAMRASSAELKKAWHRSPSGRSCARSTRAGAMAPGPCCWRWSAVAGAV